MDTFIARRLDGKLIQAAQGIDKSFLFSAPDANRRSMLPQRARYKDLILDIKEASLLVSCSLSMYLVDSAEVSSCVSSIDSPKTENIIVENRLNRIL